MTTEGITMPLKQALSRQVQKNFDHFEANHGGRFQKKITKEPKADAKVTKKERGMADIL